MAKVWRILLMSMSLSTLGCSKDSSCENCETLPKPTVFSNGEWSFVEGNQYYSGKIDTGFIRRDPAGEDITFWGPTLTSNGVIDSVFSNVIFFEKPFTISKKNLVAVGSTFYFTEQNNGVGKWLYEHIGTKTLHHIVDSYDDHLKEYKGRFSGYVVNKRNLDTCYISDGKYRIRF